MKRLRAVLLSLLMSIILLLTGCGPKSLNTSVSSTPSKTNTSPSIIFPSGTDLAFNTIIGAHKVGGPYQDRAAQIRVLTDSQSASEVSGMVYSYDADILLKADYQHYIVVVVFNGWRVNISKYLEIQKIWRSGNNVFVLAHFDDGGATALQASSSQYQTVTLDRVQLIQTGEITFKLLDESGKERATTMANITGIGK